MTSVTMRNLWTLFVTTACVAILGGCAACRAPLPQDSTEKQAEYEITLDLLEQAHKLMREVAEEHLPRGDIGEEVLVKQCKIIVNLSRIMEYQSAREVQADETEDSEQESIRAARVYPTYPFITNEVFRRMIADQKEIIRVTRRAAQELVAFQQENPGRRFVFEAGLLEKIENTCRTEEQIAFVSACMVRTLDMKILRTMQIEICFETWQLCKAHARRVAEIEADGELSQEARKKSRQSAEKQKIRLAKRFAGKQSRIAEIVNALIDAIKKPSKKEAEQ